MDVNALPPIIETKRSLTGPDKTFACRVLSRGPDSLTVLFVSDRRYEVGGLTLPAGTITFGHFWSDRPYNVYHWLAAGAGKTLAYYMNISDQTALNHAHLSFRDLAVDVLARPGHPPVVLDEDEVPADVPATLRTYLDESVAAARADLPALIPQLEQEADRIWSRLFGTARR